VKLYSKIKSSRMRVRLAHTIAVTICLKAILMIAIRKPIRAHKQISRLGTPCRGVAECPPCSTTNRYVTSMALNHLVQFVSLFCFTIDETSSFPPVHSKCSMFQVNCTLIRQLLTGLAAAAPFINLRLWETEFGLERKRQIN
jgi:hypothetical protein